MALPGPQLRGRAIRVLRSLAAYLNLERKALFLSRDPLGRTSSGHCPPHTQPACLACLSPSCLPLPSATLRPSVLLPLPCRWQMFLKIFFSLACLSVLASYLILKAFLLLLLLLFFFTFSFLGNMSAVASFWKPSPHLFTQ